MRVELRGLKVVAALSRETMAFSATLLINGRKVGTVSNDGGGGAHRLPPGSYVPLAEYADSLPQREQKIHFGCVRPDMIQPTAETVIDDLIDREQLRKDLARRVVLMCRGTVMQSKRVAAAKLPAMIDRVANDHPGYVILNRLPLDEACHLYFQRT